MCDRESEDSDRPYYNYDDTVERMLYDYADSTSNTESIETNNNDR